MGALTGTKIDTGKVYKDAIDNVHQIIDEHKSSLTIVGVAQDSNMIVKYDELKIHTTPWISIVLDSGSTTPVQIQNCYVFTIEFVIYQYLESLSFGNDTYPFLEPMWNFVSIFIGHPTLYGFANGTGRGVEVTNSALVGRRLEPDVFLTHQLNLSVSHRICKDDHS